MKTDQPLNQDLNQRAFSVEWTPWLSLGSLLMAGGLALAKHFGEGPSQLVSGGHIRVFYVAVLAYNYGTIPVTALTLLAWLLLTVVGIGRLRQRTGWKTALAAVSVATFALLWAGWSTLPKFFANYQHLTSTTFGADDYHLGVRMALDGDDYFVVSKCPHGGLSCDAYRIAPVDQADKRNLAAVRLETEEATDTLSIHTPTRVIPVTLPIP